jgi:hypothetical protein
MQTDRRAEGQTDMTKLIVAFYNFTNAPKKKAENGTLKVSLKVALNMACPCTETSA